MEDFAVLGDPWGARIAVIIGDVWQWIPFMYIVLLAGLEGRDLETEEAAMVDGAGRWQIFRNITLPMIIPVSATVILIRMIESFKIIDLPNVLTGGGPGTATESVTLQSFLTWRAFNLGSSAAIAYTLLIVVTVVATAYGRLDPAASPPCQRLTGQGAPDAMNPLRKRNVLDLSPRAKVGAYVDPARLGVRRPVPAVLAAGHLVQGADPVQQRHVLPPVHRLPADARQLEVHPGRPRQRHVSAVLQHDRRGVHERAARAGAGLDRGLRSGALPVPAAARGRSDSASAASCSRS